MVKYKIVDAHVHVGKFKVSNPKICGWFSANLENLKDYIKKENLEAVFLLSHPPVTGYQLASSEKVLEIAEKDFRVKPFCMVNILAKNIEDEIKKLRKYLSKGCVGIGEVKAEIPVNHPRMLKLFDWAGEHNLPVIIHMTEKYCYDFFRLRSLIRKLKTNLIMHGWGWWNHLQNGFIAQILDEEPNLYMDCSANSGFINLAKNLNYTKNFLEKYAEKILYGTDFPMLTTYDGTQFGLNKHHLNLLLTLNLNQKKLRKILRDNALKLLKGGGKRV